MSKPETTPEEAGEWACSECVARWMKDGTYGV